MRPQTVSSHHPYELRLGVTGHRNAKVEHSAERVGAAVRHLLDRVQAVLHRKYSNPIAWTIVSPLARGADRIVARAVLERAEAHLDVVTPFDRDEYRRDFSSPADLAEFDELLARCRHFQENPVPNADGDDTRISREDRDEGYVRVGESVVDSGEILIAVWDGEPRQGKGGTADIVKYAADRGRVVLWIDAVNPEAPPRVVQSVVLDGEELTVHCRAFPERAEELSSGFCQQGAYCVDRGLRTSRFHRSFSHERARFKQALEDSGLPEPEILAATEPILHEYVRADLLAAFYQKVHSAAVNGILYSAAIAVTAALVQLMFFPHTPQLILVEVAAMVAVFFCWVFDRGFKWHQKWLHDRYLAERLRTALFTTVAGIRPDTGVGGNPLPFYRGPRHWLNDIVDDLRSKGVDTLCPVPFEPLKKFLTTSWLAEQRGFHERNARRRHKSARRRHTLGAVLFGGTLLLAVIHYLHASPSAETAKPWLSGHVWTTFGALLLPVWAGTIHAVTSQLELERIAERSRRMKRVLSRVGHRMQYVHDENHLRNVAEETAELMKVENHEWWVLLSFQDVRLQA
jgi:hypothetical protein